VLKQIQNLPQHLQSYQKPLSSLFLLPKIPKTNKVMSFPSFFAS